MKKLINRSGISIFILSAICVTGALLYIVKTETEKNRKWYERPIIGGDMDYQLIWSMSLIPWGWGDIGEYLDTASRIKKGNYESWFQEWFLTAERVRQIADTSLADGHRTSAGGQYLRAAAYYRLADFYHSLDYKNPAYLDAAEKCRKYFILSHELKNAAMEVVEIPYENTTLDGYLFRPEQSDKDVPLLIVQQGFDGWAEESLNVALEAEKRGYACLLFNGPGQGLSVRKHNLHFRPDWENVISPVIDFAEKLPNIDSSRIGLMGISMSGVLIPRVAAYEHRISAFIVDPGYFNLYEAFLGALPGWILKAMEKKPEFFDKIVGKYAKHSWQLSQAMYIFGIDAPSQLVSGSKQYCFEKDLPHIKGNFLIMDGESETILGVGQAKALSEMLNCPVTYMLFRDEDVASLHCHAGALCFASEEMFNWLDGHL